MNFAGRNAAGKKSLIAKVNSSAEVNSTAR